MYLAVNIVGIFIFLAIAFAFSKNRRNIKWRSIILMLVINLVIAWFFTSFSVGTDIVKAAADGFNWLVDVA